MRLLIFIIKIFIIIFFTSCSGTSKIPSKPCIKNLQVEISNSWFYSNDSLYYKVNHDFLNRIRNNYKDCLLGLSSEQIIALFGKPSDTKGSKNSNLISALVYHVSPPCDNKDRDGQCTEYYFYLDKGGRVRDVEYIVLIGISNH